MKAKAIFGAAVLAGCAALVIIFQPLTRAGNMRAYTIGIPEGSAGLVIRYLADGKERGSRIRARTLLPYTLYDCCAASAQYAMGSGRLHMAVMCIDAASALVKKDNRYTITGPVILNSDVLVTRQGSKPGSAAIAVSQKRTLRQQRVIQYAGFDGKPVPMLHSAVPYAFGRGVVDGAVVDIIRAMDLEGDVHPAAKPGGKEIVTHVLVVKKTILHHQAFTEFIDRYSRAVDRLQNRRNLADFLKTYSSKKVTIGDIDLWQKMNVRFTHPLNSLRQG